MLGKNAIHDLPSGQSSSSDLDELIASLSRAIESDPTDVQAYCERGIAYMKRRHCQMQRDLDIAIADFSDAIHLRLTGADACLRGGAVYRSNGNADRVIADFARAFGIPPKELTSRVAQLRSSECNV